MAIKVKGYNLRIITIRPGRSDHLFSRKKVRLVLVMNDTHQLNINQDLVSPGGEQCSDGRTDINT